jgi:hypothetical protein
VPAAVISITAKNEAEDRKLFDRAGVLYTRYCEAKPMLKEWEAVKKLIRDRHENHASGEPIRETGNLYHVDLSPRENEWTITSKTKAFAALKAALGAKLAEALGYTKKLIEAHVPAAKRDAFSATLRTGTRDVTAVLIVPKEAA